MVAHDFNLPPRQSERPGLVPVRRRPRWQRALAWTAGVLVVLLLVAAVGVYLLLHSSSFHQYVLRTAQQKTSAALNTRVTARDFAVHLSNLGLDLYDVTIYGVGPGANAPLLGTNHLSLGVRILSALHRQWNLDNVLIDHPVVHLVVNQNGDTNLPQPQPSNSNSNTNLFDLAIGHIVLDRGEVYYNDRKNTLSADLHDLTFQSSYDTTGNGRYFGTLSYRDGHLQYGAYAPMEHDLQAQFDARRNGMTLSNTRVRVGNSQLLLDASLQNYNQPTVHAKYGVTLDAAELRRVMKNASLPAGTVLVNGTAAYSSVANRPLLDTLSLDGDVKSSLLAVRTPSLRTNIRDLSARYHLANGNADVQDFRARVLGGSLSANATVRDLPGEAQGHAVAALRGISVADLKSLANASSLNQFAVSGRADGNVDATWRGNMQDLVARVDAAANANLAPRQNANGAAVPLNAKVRAQYYGRTQEIALDHSYIHTAQTSIDLNGTVSRRSALQVRVQANDLHELETVAESFQKPAPGQPSPQPLGLYGTASFNGTVRGSTRAPQIDGQLNAGNVRLRGSSFRVLRTNVEANPSLISLQNGDLEPATRGRLTFNLRAGLHQWSYAPSSPITADVHATQLSLAELARAANATTPMSGTLNANLTLHGTQLNPIGRGNLDLSNARIAGEPIETAHATFQGTGDAVHANLLLRITAGTAQGEVTYYPKQEGYDAQLKATNIHLDQIQSLRESNLQLAGILNLVASGRGTLKDPQGQLSLTVPELDVQKQQIRNVNLQANVANHQGTFNLTSSVINTPLRAQGKVALTGDYEADATFDTPVIPLEPLIAAYAPAQAANVSGQTEIHATLHGPLKNKALLQAHLNIPTLAVTYKAATTANPQAAIQLAAVRPIRADYADGVLSLESNEIKGTGTDIRFQGRIPLDSNAPSTLVVNGTVDLNLAQLLDPEIISRGQLQFDINAGGRRDDPDVEGKIHIVNASFATPDAPLGLTKGNGELTLRRDRLDVSQFTGEIGGGTVTASGAVTYRPAVQFNLGLKGSGVRLFYPQGVRSDLDANLAMTGTTDSAQLQGLINVNRLSFTQAFDLNTFLTQFSGVASPPPTQSFADNLKLNVAVRSTSQLNAVSSNISIQGDANLRVIGTASDPVIVGRTNLTGGDLIFLGSRYLIQGGTITFINTYETEPVVNLQVTTRIQQYDIAMHFQGPADQLHTNYTSDPSLPPADIIHLLAFGKTEEASNAASAQSTSLGAESLVASQVTGQITSRLQKAAGISQISVDPVLEQNGNEPPGARVTIQQRVTSKLYVTFATDVTQTSNEQVQLEYHVNPKWSVSGVRDQNGGFGIDGRYHKDF
jgi:translocation and assembly module TamB